MPRQVLIEALVAEIALTDETRLGLAWPIRSGKFTVASVSNAGTAIPGTSVPPGIASPLPIPPIPGHAALLGPLGAGLTAFGFDTGKFFAILNMLADQSRVNIISNP